MVTAAPRGCNPFVRPAASSGGVSEALSVDLPARMDLASSGWGGGEEIATEGSESVGETGSAKRIKREADLEETPRPYFFWDRPNSIPLSAFSAASRISGISS